ncbi:Calcium-transporting ATPase [uncultured Desulfobacterium sp.]|uniref:Calcium-transporting ATPase n=1 Tax=uncultured Desulfobacterium sp. TaxID=201089 RepID=A0A445MUB4_9BACT|nr:Calcium-transporting ATPase [uncultured Desulfobacterium sp.]
MEKTAWHSMEADKVLKELESDPNKGLSENEAEGRLKKYGYNQLKTEEKISPLALLIAQFKNVLIIILLIAIVLSALVGEVVDAAIIAVIVVFCAVLGFIQEYRAERALEALKKMLSPTITVLRAEKEQEIPSKELVPGDILLLEAGDRIPADARLIENYSLRCNEAAFSGESVPIGKDVVILPEETRVSDRKNMVFTGTTVTYGRGRAVVTSTGMVTEFGKIAKEVSAVVTEKTPLEKRTEEIGKWIGMISLMICFLVAGISVIREVVWGRVDLSFIITMVMFAVALAVAAVPEALAAIVTGALAIGMHQMAARNALVRKMPAVETLGCTTVICSDKTGTLTRGEMTVRKIFTAGMEFDVTGVGYEPEGEFRGPVQVKNSMALETLLKAGLLCSDAALEQHDGKWLIKGDPTEGALVVAAAKANLHQAEFRLKNPRTEEIPFSSERKRMTTIHKMEDGKYTAFMKGAPEVILKRCSHLMDHDGVIREVSEAERQRLNDVNEHMAQAALRVLGVAFRDCRDGIQFGEDGIEHDMVFLGLVGMMDPPRKEAISATRVCRQVGIKPVMITGDHSLTAVAVAKEIGFFNDGDLVLTGVELEEMSEDDLDKIVDRVSVYARVSPMDKLKIVRAWKNRGEVVAMTGDGVNDAPALKQADIGIAMGIAGTEVAKEASDMVLNDDNFATIVTAIERGRWIYDNIKKYLTYLLRCNITEVVVIGGVVLVSGPEYLPLLPAAILYMNLATDGLPALALGISPPDPDLMQRPPRDPKESVFSWDVRAFIALALLIEIPFFFFLFYHELYDKAHARTEIFFLFIIIELVIALNFRSMRYSIFKAPPHKWLLLALFWEIALIFVLIQFPSMREAFGIIKPSASDLGIIAGFGLAVFISMEIVKGLVRSKMARAEAKRRAGGV